MLDSHQQNGARLKPGLDYVFEVLGLGLGLAALLVIGVTLILEPVVVAEENAWIRYCELSAVGVGLVALARELAVRQERR